MAGVVYSMLFVLFGAGSLFGGLCIPYDNIKTVFKPFYYLSVPAWGYRSILINDLVSLIMLVWSIRAVTQLGRYRVY